jgi:hypothetical protein
MARSAGGHRKLGGRPNGRRPRHERRSRRPSRYVRVFDPRIVEPTAQSDDEPMDRQEAMREGDVMDVDEAMHAESMHAGDAPKHDSSGDWLEREVGG